ncbi:MAG: PIG-L family deacetylase [Myxococcaceae bacterium]
MSVLYVSPHFDDVVFSCAGELLKKVAAGEHIVVCTVFSEGTGSKTRVAEDAAAMEVLGAEAVHLGFEDAPDREGFTPSFQTLVLDAQVRSELVRQVASAIGAVVNRRQPGEVWLPLGVGGHVDHLTVFEAARGMRTDARICFYEERPYAFVPAFRALRRLQLRGGRLRTVPSPRMLFEQIVRGGCPALLDRDADRCVERLAESLSAIHCDRRFDRLMHLNHHGPDDLGRAAALIERYASQVRWLFGVESPASVWRRLASTHEGWMERSWC